MSKQKPLGEWTLEELKAERERLADEKRGIRVRQNEVQAYITYREAMTGLPEELQHRITIDGGLAPKGGQA